MSNSRVILVLAIGLLTISASAVLIKMCKAPALVIAFYRLGIASVLYYGMARHKVGPLGKHYHKSQVRWALLAGLALALHFATWIQSLSLTSVASSVVLVTTSPIWVALGSTFFLGEKPSRMMLIGMAITICGSIIITGADFQLSAQHLVGDVLAIAGAIFAGIYLLIGRRLRRELDTFPYVTIVYSAAAVFTLVFLAATGDPLLEYDTRTFVLFLLIALLPQVIGHTSLNWALKYISATAVAVVTLGEPIGASFLAWIILNEGISLVQLAGMMITMLGLAVSLFVETRKNE